MASLYVVDAGFVAGLAESQGFDLSESEVQGLCAEIEESGVFEEFSDRLGEVVSDLLGD